MIPLIVPDEPALFAYDGASLEAVTAGSPVRVLSLASAFHEWFGLHVLDEPSRRALLRRLGSRHAGALPPATLKSGPFARNLAADIDTGRANADAAFAPLLADYASALVALGVPDAAQAAERVACAERGQAPPVPSFAPRILFAQAATAPLDARFLAALRARAGVPVEIVALEGSPPAAGASLLDTLQTALRFAATREDQAARRLIVGPFSAVPEVDARALLVVADRRGGLLEAIAAQRIALSEDGRRTAYEFAKSLGAIAQAYRAPNAGASALLATIVVELCLARRAQGSEFRTLAAAAAVAAAFDRVLPATGGTWEAAELSAAFDAELGCGQARPVSAPFEIAVPAARETPRAMVAKRTHYSASSLNTFAECRRKWFFRYVCLAVEDRGSSASFYGTAFHWALERFHEHYPNVHDADRAVLERTLEGCVNAAFERYRDGFGSNVEYELQRRRAQRTAAKYAQWIVARDKREPFEVIGCEISAELDLDGFAFVGYIDRLDADVRTGGVTVIDYKTGTIAQSAAEYRDKVRAFAEFQLPFYYWARTAAGDRVTKLALIPLKDALIDVAPIELEIVLGTTQGRGRRDDAATGTIAVRDLEAARAKMIELCTLIESGTLDEFETTDDPDACRYCAYRASCRERPAPREERFAR